MSGKTGALEETGGGAEVAARSFCVPSLLCTRRMFSPILRLRKSTIAGCQSAMGLAQFFEQASGKPEFCERALELIVVLEFLALLRGHVGLEKNLARVVGLSGQVSGREEKTKTGEQNQTDFLHGVEKSDDMHVWLGCNAGLHCRKK